MKLKVSDIEDEVEEDIDLVIFWIDNLVNPKLYFVCSLKPNEEFLRPMAAGRRRGAATPPPIKKLKLFKIGRNRF